MGRFSVAIRAFFAALTSAAATQRLRTALEQPALPNLNAGDKLPRETVRIEAPRPSRSEAITLLAALQREGRFVDLVKQPLANFSDEEIGAAARNVLADCGTVIERFFRLAPLAKQAEGAACDVPAGYDPACYKLGGRVEGNGPFRGQLVHHGWKATTLNLPAWTGSNDAALIIAPAEVEVT